MPPKSSGKLGTEVPQWGRSVLILLDALVPSAYPAMCVRIQPKGKKNIM